MIIVRSHDALFTISIGGYEFLMSLQLNIVRSHDGRSSELVNSYIAICFTTRAL